jgi:host factor-I protein
MKIASIHDSFFATAQQDRKHIIIFLSNGSKISGRIRSYDKYSLLVESASQEQLIFKHSISTTFLCRNKQCRECNPVRVAVVCSEVINPRPPLET